MQRLKPYFLLTLIAREYIFRNTFSEIISFERITFFIPIEFEKAEKQLNLFQMKYSL